MSSSDDRRAAGPRAVLMVAALLALAGCRPGADDSRETGPAVPQGPSHAADSVIESAKTPEERRALEAARDEVDREMREKARALDEEIERLRKENARLEKEVRTP